MMIIPIKASSDKLLPERAHPTDAGADLRSEYYHEIPPGKMEIVDTGVAVRIPDGFVGLVFSRSGQGKLRVSLANSVGVIDSTYTGNIKVMVVNEGTSIYVIHPRETKVAQLVVVPIVLPTFNPVDSLEKTDRGTNGFGSTGI